jgi:hypothetical protein
VPAALPASTTTNSPASDSRPQGNRSEVSGATSPIAPAPTQTIGFAWARVQPAAKRY